MTGFFEWVEVGGGYAVWFAGFIVSVIAIVGGCVKAYRHLTSPAHEARKASEEGDKQLHSRIDELESNSKECADRFQNDFLSIKRLRREQERQADVVALLSEGMFLIIQHLVTDDHIDDMQEWMREYTKQTVKSDISKS